MCPDWVNLTELSMRWRQTLARTWTSSSSGGVVDDTSCLTSTDAVAAADSTMPWMKLAMSTGRTWPSESYSRTFDASTRVSMMASASSSMRRAARISALVRPRPLGDSSSRRAATVVRTSIGTASLFRNSWASCSRSLRWMESSPRLVSRRSASRARMTLTSRTRCTTKSSSLRSAPARSKRPRSARARSCRSLGPSEKQERNERPTRSERPRRALAAGVARTTRPEDRATILAEPSSTIEPSEGTMLRTSLAVEATTTSASGDHVTGRLAYTASERSSKTRVPAYAPSGASRRVRSSRAKSPIESTPSALCRQAPSSSPPSSSVP
mmetsp:Transcript_8644/g.27149  ORF Transcript_8644/g.27149 Transcript_8644/m.27149 type:complete len:326 (+) Transcript_8644:674-1651(+)